MAKITPLGKWLRLAIKERHTSLRAVGRAAGLSHVTLHNTIWGEHVPTAQSCLKMAEALGEDPDYVLELAGHRRPREYKYLMEFPHYVRRRFPDEPGLRRALMAVYNAWMDREEDESPAE
jgi:transcriptional regulator with XRE-family HTH domain